MTNNTTTPALNNAFQLAQEYLSTFAGSDSFSEDLTTAFGSEFDTTAAATLQQQWLAGDFSAFSSIEVIASSEINGAYGAYAQATDKIYLSSEFLSANADNPTAVAAILLEEMGHAIDAQLNTFDSAGDEGAIFSSLLQGKTLSAAQLQTLRSEDDTATVILNEELTQIEQANANILFVSDSGTDDANIPAVLRADGHTVTVVSDDFSGGNNPTLLGDLSSYDAVYWSATGTGFGSTHTNAAVFSNLEGYVSTGGRVFVTGYDSVSSPTDPLLISFLGASGNSDGGTPSSASTVSNSLTTGVVDIQGILPTGAFGDQDTLFLSAGDTAVGVVPTSNGGWLWTLRTLGTGEIAYVSNGAFNVFNGDGEFASWLNTSSSGDGAYNAALRNFVAGIQESGLSAGGEATFVEDGAPILVDDTLAINDLDGATLSGATVSITGNFDMSEDSLGIDGQSGTSGNISGINWSYNSATGIMTLNGNASTATYESVLRQVTYGNADTIAPSTGDRSVEFALGPIVAGGPPTPTTGSPTFDPATGHYYEFVAAGGDWNASQVGAANRSFMGLQGYLATITSAAENTLITSLIGGQPAWIGASDAAAEGQWEWVTGPEAGTLFWQGTGFTGNSVGGFYENWNVGEPNDVVGIENHAHLWADGTWNDHSNPAIGYVVEYGGIPASGGPLQLTDTATVEVQAVNDEPVADAGGAYVINEGDGLTLNASASSDPEGDTLTYRWDVDGDGDYDENITGVNPTLTAAQLTVLGLGNGPTSNTVTVEVSDAVDTNTSSTTLTVNNVAPTIDAVGPFTFEENTANFTPTPNGTQVVASLSATDPGVGDTFSNWQIVSGNTNVDGDGNAAFAIDSATGEITVNDADDLDFELNPTFSLGVTVSDGTDTSAVEIITINLTDIEEGSARSERLYGSAAANDQIDGLDGNDRLYGYAGTDTLFGGSGRDFLYGGDDNDLLDGGDGNDVLDGQNGDDRVFGREGNDIVRGGNGNDTLEGNNGNDKLYGFAGNDMLVGGDGTDSLYGGNGNDFLDGGLGIDNLYADQGADSMVLRLGDGNDKIHRFDISNDVLVLGSGLTANDLTYTFSGLNTEISAGGEVLATLVYVQTNGIAINTTPLV